MRHALAVDEKCDFYRQACLQGSMLVYCIYSVVQKWVFAPQERYIAPINVKFGMRERSYLPNLTFVAAKMWQYSADTVKISYFAHKIDKTSLVPYFVKAA